MRTRVLVVEHKQRARRENRVPLIGQPCSP